ncbi:MAG: hypothetical protein F6K63_21720 [Moorea sp. SIO1G6]|uniref:hypothetical protein n=1 Tax=Moorena sp. SIO1G6 TaxID=2607840 RepID=UPI0013C03A1A|nr:hypothetical protein [Moorena sp. SIO1G6]NET66863.1 hypothetical protein [Moorena sp. SIO1G6]
MKESLRAIGHFCVPIALAVFATYTISSDVQKSIKNDVVPWLQVAALSTTTVNQGLQAAKQLRRSK